MAGLVRPSRFAAGSKNVDARDKPGHDGRLEQIPLGQPTATISASKSPLSARPYMRRSVALQKSSRKVAPWMTACPNWATSNARSCNWFGPMVRSRPRPSASGFPVRSRNPPSAPCCDDWKTRATPRTPWMDEPMSIRPPSRARGLRRKPSSASSTGSATAPWKRSWSAWWTRRCSTSVSYARWPTRLRRPRQEGRDKDRGEG